ncbi:hypothetical protein SAMN06265338_10443 [Rhodoblastus acidophilus]|uniref:Uncharacterized protein n=1 Tax=Rhodoblastus acidophilus TaxID=1074 RepID=A0A212RES7_RHOAC|nr:hypothetical protein [Rhodoblastus acidophilus]SNB70881.1 hypothetical protein SAMN06265338_10443 [Rhodoblastus acidophilus]
MFARLCLASALLLLPAAAQAQEPNACDKFKWSVAREKSWFEAAPQKVASGDAAQVGKGYAVALKPLAETAFAKTPARAPKPETFAALLTVPAIDKPGLYDITLSGEGWIDAVQNGAIARTVDFSGLVGCAAVRKSVRYQLESGPLTVQISNVAGESVLLAIAPVE